MLALASFANAANLIELKISDKGLSQYKVKAETYKFSESSLTVNKKLNVVVPEMETRGQSSIAAPRRNFGLKLEQAIQIDSVDAKNINLLSMWNDRGYISTKLGLMIVDKLQIGAPIRNEYTELRINGKTNGLYLIVEKPKAAAGDTPYIVRRGYNSRFKTSEAKVGKTVTADELNEIERTLHSIYTAVGTKSGTELYSELKQVMDINSYMKWMVMNSLFTNGDGADEVFFYVDKKMYKNGKIYFRIMPWDFDDLFKPMHGLPINMKELKKNPDSIIYNFEDKLDYKFAHDDYLYSQLKATAKNLLVSDLSQANSNFVLDQIERQIAPFLDREDIMDLGKLDAGRKNLPYSKIEILNTIAERKLEIEKRRAWLLQRAN